MIATASFDLFDTILVRPVCDPHDIFRLVEREFSARNWAVARIAAERVARAIKPSGEVSLDEIYAAPPLDSWREDLNKFRAAELRWESHTQIDPAAAERVAAARAGGAQILYITDMYLPRDFLIERLAPIWRSGDMLVISHEAGDSKGRGLWANLASQFPRPWHHVGDHIYCDVVQPTRYGITSEHWTRAHPNRAELALRQDNPNRPVVTGLSRLTRALRPLNAHALWDDGANVAGPMLYGFVHWILTEARSKGISWIGFLSRDGQLPARIAQLLRERDPTLPEISYLYGSRHAWYLALFDPASPRHCLWVSRAPRPTVRGIFSNLDIDPRSLEASLSAIGFPPIRWQDSLTLRERQQLLQDLSVDATAVKLFAEKRESRLTQAIGYLRQKGLFSHRHVALVDIGWSGSMLDALQELLAHCSQPAPKAVGFFFGLHQNAGPDRFCYLLSPCQWPHWLTAFPSVVEMLAPGDHGQTIAYKTSAVEIEPVLAEDLVAPVNAIRALHDGALSYVKAATKMGEAPPHCDKLLWNFIVHPDEDQIRRWSEFRFWTWQRPSDEQPPPLIRRLRLHELFRRIFSPWRNVDAWPWPTATMRLTLPRTPNFLLTLLVLKFQCDRSTWAALHAAIGALKSCKRRLQSVRSR